MPERKVIRGSTLPCCRKLSEPSLPTSLTNILQLPIILLGPHTGLLHTPSPPAFELPPVSAAMTPTSHTESLSPRGRTGLQEGGLLQDRCPCHCYRTEGQSPTARTLLIPDRGGWCWWHQHRQTSRAGETAVSQHTCPYAYPKANHTSSALS